uniref:Uncharacterized protein n=1 Tax=Nothobranchius kadleci TaxID=1051664 RepID=A0A1A8DS21_NOTKA
MFVVLWACRRRTCRGLWGLKKENKRKNVNNVLGSFLFNINTENIFLAIHVIVCGEKCENKRTQKYQWSWVGACTLGAVLVFSHSSASTMITFMRENIKHV